MEQDEHNLLCGKPKEAEKAEDQLTLLRTGKSVRSRQSTTTSAKDVEIVTPLDEHGNYLLSLDKKDVEVTEEDRKQGGRRGIKREANDMTVQEMQQEMRSHRDQSIDDVMMRNIMKQGKSYRPLGSSTTGFDEEDEIDIKYYKGKEEFATEKKKQEMEMKEAIEAQKKWDRIVSNCYYCFGSETMPKDNLIALGDHTYLTMCAKMRLNNWHVQICPLQHIWSETECDEDTTQEIFRFKQALVKMAHSLGKGCLFFEEVHRPHGRQHCVVECVLVEKEIEQDAEIYFHKAMMECDDEWQASNRKCMDTSEKGIQKSVPPGFPYFFVEWSSNSGHGGSLTHVIEDEKIFKRNMGQDVLAGMMGLPSSQMLRNSDANVQEVLKGFLKVWKKFDWTVELDGGS